MKTKYGRPNLEFNLDGTLKYVELDIMNLNNMGMWDKVNIHILDILYNSHQLLNFSSLLCTFESFPKFILLRIIENCVLLD